MLYGKCKTGPLHTQQPRSFILYDYAQFIRP